MDIGRFVDYNKKMIDNVSRVIVGKDDVIQRVITSFICSGHVLLEDIPGTGYGTFPLPEAQLDRFL